MHNRTRILASLMVGSLVLTLTPYAQAATEFEVTTTTTLEQLRAAIADPETTTVIFNEDVSFHGGVIIDQPLTFRVADGVTVDFHGEGLTTSGLMVRKEFTLQNNGTVNIRDFDGYGVHLRQNDGGAVVIEGDGKDDSALNITNTQGYGLDGQSIAGPFTVKNTSLTVATRETTTEGPVAFSKHGNPGISPVRFENAKLEATHSSKNPYRWRPSIYTELPMTFTNSEVISTTSQNYNFSAVSSGADIVFDHTDVTLTTTADAVTKGFFIPKPFVSVNTSNNTITVTNGSSITSNILPPSGVKQDFEFQDANYVVNNSKLKGQFLGTDYKQQNTSKITITGDSLIDIPRTPTADGAMDFGIETVVDGGAVDIPPLPQLYTVKNSAGEVVTELVSSATGNSIPRGCNLPEYPVSNTNTDGKKHIWVQTVNVEYYQKPTGAAEDKLATRTLIKGTSLNNAFNNFYLGSDAQQTPNATGAVPVPEGSLDGKWVVFEPAAQAGTTLADDTPVCETIKLSWQEAKIPLFAIPDVPIEEVVVMVGDPIKPTDGLVGVPNDATVEVLEPGDTSVPGRTTQKVKITFGNGSSRIKVVPILVKKPVVPTTSTTSTSTTTTSQKPTETPKTTEPTTSQATTSVSTMTSQPGVPGSSEPSLPWLIPALGVGILIAGGVVGINTQGSSLPDDKQEHTAPVTQSPVPPVPTKGVQKVPHARELASTGVPLLWIILTAVIAMAIGAGCLLGFKRREH